MTWIKDRSAACRIGKRGLSPRCPLQLAQAVRTELRANGFGVNDVEAAEGIVTIWGIGESKVENVSVAVVWNSSHGPGFPIKLPIMGKNNGATASASILWPSSE